MNLSGFLDPQSGLPTAAPYQEFTPPAGAQRPLYKNVWLSGWVSAGTPEIITLEAISVSGVGSHKLKILTGSSIEIAYGPQFSGEFAKLAVGSTMALEVVISGYTAIHLRGTEHRARASLIRTFWTQPPAPVSDSKS
jgi:hypothetical protein